jgi:hypothetical protein
MAKTIGGRITWKCLSCGHMHYEWESWV